MPDTDRAGAVTAGQNVLKAISAITIGGIDGADHRQHGHRRPA